MSLSDGIVVLQKTGMCSAPPVSSLQVIGFTLSLHGFNHYVSLSDGLWYSKRLVCALHHLSTISRETSCRPIVMSAVFAGLFASTFPLNCGMDRA